MFTINLKTAVEILLATFEIIWTTFQNIWATFLFQHLVTLLISIHYMLNYEILLCRNMLKTLNQRTTAIGVSTYHCISRLWLGFCGFATK